MAKKANRVVEPFKYVLPADRVLPAGEQSVFTFRPLTQGERMRATDTVEVVHVEGSGERQIRFRTFEQAREVVLACLIKVENFPSEEPIPYPGDGTREEKYRYLEMLDDYDVYRLGDHVIDHSTLGPPEKNSLTP